MYKPEPNTQWTFRALKSAALLFLGVFILSTSTSALGSFTPPTALTPTGDNVILNDTFEDEAWMVYTYQIDDRGVVVNAEIHSSNGVEAVEQEVLLQVKSMTFHPATNNGKPVKVASDPVVFTHIVDKPREMSPGFAKIHKAAEGFISMEQYDEAFDELAEMKSYRGRSIYEEVKFQTLAATLADRWDDQAAELQHLNRVVELQTLADYKRVDHPYVEPEQYALVLERVMNLQLSRMMLADAAATLETITRIKIGPEIVTRASSNYSSAAERFSIMAEVAIKGELLPMYRSGPGVWKTGLSRSKFSISDVKGEIDSVFLSCNRGEFRLAYPQEFPWTSPRGWTDCNVDVSGKVGSRFTLRQYAK